MDQATLELASKWLPIVNTALIGVFAANISSRQLKIARAKLKLDLYDRRMQIFTGVEQLFSKIVEKGHAPHEDIRAFYRDTFESRFLFGKDIADQLETLHRQSITLHFQQRKIDTTSPDHLPVGPAREELCNENNALILWFGDQREKTERMFRRYIGFEE